VRLYGSQAASEGAAVVNSVAKPVGTRRAWPGAVRERDPRRVPVASV